MKQTKAWISVCFAVLALISCKREQSLPPAELFLVVDTSGSMAGGTMDLVKQKLPTLLESVQVGDTVHLIQFDEKPQAMGEFRIQSPEDRQVVEKAILELKPSGAYTDIKELLAFLKENTVPENPEARQYIVVLSDGIDDPRPGRTARRERVALQEYEAEEKLPVQEPYIFYVYLGDPGVEIAEEGLKEELAELSDEVRVVKAAEEEEAGLKAVKQDIEKTRQSEDWWGTLWQKIKGLPVWIWWVVAALLLLLLFLLYRLFREEKPLEGKLSFYEASEHPSMAREVNLHRFHRRDLVIGSSAEAVVRIKDREFPARIRLKAKRAGKDFLFGIPKKDLQRMEFLVQKKRGFISSGDRFRIANYTFEYSHGTKK